MASNVVPADYLAFRSDTADLKGEAHSSGVSWGAVIGGAFVAAAFSLILLALGAGFGLSAVSPWSNVGASASTAGAMAIAWLILIEIVASGLGGYLTGRLRTKWALIHTDEVYFRDTANGFLAWAVALIVSVSFMATAAASMVGRAPASGAVGTAAEASTTGPDGYYVDTLFRSDRLEHRDVTVSNEAARMFANALRANQMPDADQTYLAQLIAAQTGVTVAQAQNRITAVLAQARQDVDAARKATAHLLLWLFIALLAGALSASYAATIGGRQRDHVKAV